MNLLIPELLLARLIFCHAACLLQNYIIKLKQTHAMLTECKLFDWQPWVPTADNLLHCIRVAFRRRLRFDRDVISGRSRNRRRTSSSGLDGEQAADGEVVVRSTFRLDDRFLLDVMSTFWRHDGTVTIGHRLASGNVGHDKDAHARVAAAAVAVSRVKQRALHRVDDANSIHKEIPIIRDYS